jgi:phosphoribosylaminoimidazolecarboxamide formyltransferase/IMP cyclohydrolase
MVGKKRERLPISRALVSVFDKTNLEKLARGLNAAGIKIVSTGSTAAAIKAAGISVTAVEDITGFPECLDGRVKTLHPAIHAAILADCRLPSHQKQLADLDIEPFDLVVVNLYPFSETVSSGAGADECIEKIDIGGPTMVRAAAKNHANVAVVVNPDRYDEVLAVVKRGGFSLNERKNLAREAFQHTAEYDMAVATWTNEVLVPGDGPIPAWQGAAWRRLKTLRYGENPHQAGAVFVKVNGSGGLAEAEQLGGKEMSYNNFVDADAARRAAEDFTRPAVAIIKHANPCGIATGLSIAEAHAKAHACDSLSAFGGVIATNRPVTEELAKQIAPIFTEVVVAPAYDDAAIRILQEKKNLRILRVPAGGYSLLETRQISGGALVQERDLVQADGDEPKNWHLVSGAPADKKTLADLEFAWRAVRSVKSNAVLLASNQASVGIGMGQVNRLDSCKLAVERANTLADNCERARGAVAASDAFFPFADGLQILLKAGVKAVVQPGGSVRDDEVIAVAKKAKLTMYFTGTRHFYH